MSFEKIDLNKFMGEEKWKSQRQPTLTMTRRKTNSDKFNWRILQSKKVGIVVAVVFLFVLFIIFGVVLPAKKTYSAMKKTQTQAQAVAWAMKQQNVELASQQLGVTRADLEETRKDLHAMAYIHYIPLLNWYYNDADHLINAGFDGLDSADTIVNAVKPYADVLGLKGGHSFSGGSAQDRIQTAVLTMGKVTPKIDDIAASLDKAKVEVDAVNPSHYPSFLGGGKINAQLTQVKQYLDEGSQFVSQARPLIKVLPSMLGEPDPKKYLIVFQNDKELRPSGGFITAYAVFKVEHGVMKVEKSSDIYELDATISNKPKAPRPILQYLPKVYEWNLRDTNLSPDFIVSMNDFKTLYDKSDGPKVDGIIALDTNMLVSTMKILGDIQTEGTTFSTQTNAICDCPQVIYALEDADRPVNYIKSNRKGLIGDLMYAIMQKAFSSSPKLYWGPLFQNAITQISQKHLLFDVYNSDAQSGLESLNAAGQIQPFQGDYFHINDSNFAGGKSNLFVKEAVTQDYQVKDDGAIVKTVTVKYKNDHSPSDCNLETGGLCLNTVLRDWNRVYVPLGSKLISSTGSEVKVSTYDELGKTVFESFFTIRPHGSKTYTLSYQLPFKVKSGSPLPLLVQKQPGTSDNQYTITKNDGGVTLNQFSLLTDQKFTISL